MLLTFVFLALGKGVQHHRLPHPLSDLLLPKILH